MAKKPTSKKPAPSNELSRIVSQARAAAHCEMSQNAFRVQLLKYPDAPVKKNGPGKAWEYDLDKLDAWRASTGALNWKKKGDDENNPSFRTKSNQADLLDIKLAQMRGELITKENAIRETSTGFAWWAREIDTWPDKLGRKFGFTPEQVTYFRKLADDARNNAQARFAKAGLLPR